MFLPGRKLNGLNPYAFHSLPLRWKPLTTYLGLVLFGFARGSGEPSKLHRACSTTNVVKWTLIYTARQESLVWGLKG